MVVFLGVSFCLNSLGWDDCHDTSTFLAASIVASGTSKGRLVFIMLKYWLLVNKDVAEGLLVVVAIFAEARLDIIDYLIVTKVVLVCLIEIVILVASLVEVFELFEVAVTSLCCSGQENSRDNLMHIEICDVCIQ